MLYSQKESRKVMAIEETKWKSQISEHIRTRQKSAVAVGPPSASRMESKISLSTVSKQM